MTKRTKKVGISGKYGVRYGVRVRKRMADVESARVQKYQCPKCLTQNVKRTDTGIWKCRKCNLVFAGGAYVPQITVGITREEFVEENVEYVEDKTVQSGEPEKRRNEGAHEHPRPE